MNAEFEKIINKFPGMITTLVSSPPLSKGGFHNAPSKGIYVFYDEDDKPIYVGRSDRMKSRLGEHSRPSSTHTSATFAFILAKKIWDTTHPDEFRTRGVLELDEKFKPLYLEKKNEVAAMKVRVIEILDPVEQALFEIYASLELETPHNVWKNH